ncbi:hydroxymethylglutaryl-CoA synthase [Canibacter zhoujuaniae]|uniref:hydroxymethylglutaryl-CoA synthase n=1 Tax=Canibacter zhoujuaniae TaxID=2708343 RepID=UPI0014229635|nr:hydroxymethylglutaryl-CoA synthase [Canibacter zhoujuaniae]
MKLGIVDMEMATAHHSVSLSALAHATNVDPNKYRFGLRQENFSMPALDEDAVTLGATAASRVLARTGKTAIRTLIFATESSVDQSKSAGVFAADLLDLSVNTRIVETKQACYAGTAALQMALGIVARNPQEQVLVIASDIARYAVNTAGEPTQGAGAVAMVVGADPQLLEIEPQTGVWSAHIDDFWRPNDLSTPLVDGARSLDAYLGAFTGAWEDYLAHGGAGLDEIDYFVHHQPFTKMAVKGHRRLVEHTGKLIDEQTVEPGLRYTTQFGNSYTASLYLGLLSLLHSDADLDGKRIGLYSYGSGATGEFFTGVVQPGYRRVIDSHYADAAINEREELSFEEYRALHAAHERGSKHDYQNPRVTRAPFRFVGVRDGARSYQRNTLPTDSGVISTINKS